MKDMKGKLGLLLIGKGIPDKDVDEDIGDQQAELASEIIEALRVKDAGALAEALEAFIMEVKKEGR